MDDGHTASTIPYSNANAISASPPFYQNPRRVLNTQNAPQIPVRPRSYAGGPPPHFDVHIAEIEHLWDELSQQVSLRMESERQVESLQAELNTQHVAYQQMERQMLESTFALELQINELKNSIHNSNHPEESSTNRDRNDYITHAVLNKALDELAERIIGRVVQLVGVSQPPPAASLCGVSSSVPSAISPSHSRPTFAQAALTQVSTLTTGVTPQAGYVQPLPDPVSTTVIPASKEQHTSDTSLLAKTFGSKSQPRYHASILPLESHGQVQVYSKHSVLPKFTRQIDAA